MRRARGDPFPSFVVVVPSWEEEGLRLTIDVNIYGGTVTLFAPESVPATKWFGRCEDFMCRWGRDSLYEGFERRDCTSGCVVMRCSAAESVDWGVGVGVGSLGYVWGV